MDVAHPAAENMIELSQTQDEECGDGTTSVIILGAYLSRLQFSKRNLVTFHNAARTQRPSSRHNLCLQQSSKGSS
jgi:hypothetical protein